MAIWNVTDQTELNAAIAGASGGDTVNIATGSYGAFNNAQNYASPVLFRATDPANPPVFGPSDIGGSNIHIQDVVFQYTWQSGDVALTPLVKIEGASNVQFQNVLHEGDLIGSGGFPVGGANGLAVRSNSASSHIWWRDCTFRNFFKCVKANSCNGHRFTGCEFYNIRSDGATYDGIAGTEAYDYPGRDTASSADFGLVVEYCYGHDWQRAADGAHPDFWQVQRTSGQGSHWVYFLYNVFDAAAGNYGQVLFGGDSGQSKNATTEHSNFHFIGNLIYASHSAAISHTWVNNVVCQRNTLIWAHLDAGDGPGKPSIMFVGSTNVLIEGNIACAINHTTNTNYTVTNNVATVDDANYSSYFDFLASAYSGIANPPDAYNDYQIKAGSALDVVGVGSPLQKKVGGWGGAEEYTHVNYPGGNKAGGGGPTIPTLPVGSVAASVTVP